MGTHTMKGPMCTLFTPASNTSNRLEFLLFEWNLLPTASLIYFTDRKARKVGEKKEKKIVIFQW